MDQFQRTELIIGKDAVEKLKSKHVAIFGLGGVGGFVCEALVRVGIGEFDLIDKDVVDVTNINRQLIALHSSVGEDKVKVMKDRMIDINPDVKVTIHKKFFLADSANEFPFEKYDYIIDAIDTISAKIELVKIAHENNIPIVSAMGAGNKISASRLKIADIFDTKVCPVAKIMRNEVKKLGIKHLRVVYSEEEPLKIDCKNGEDSQNNRNKIVGSISYVPAVAGLLMAQVVVKDLLEIKS